MNLTTLKAKDGFQLAAYVAKPEGIPRGAIVVVQEIFGVNSHIQSICDRLAENGYVAIAPGGRACSAPQDSGPPRHTGGRCAAAHPCLPCASHFGVGAHRCAPCICVAPATPWAASEVRAR